MVLSPIGENALPLYPVSGAFCILLFLSFHHRISQNSRKIKFARAWATPDSFDESEGNTGKLNPAYVIIILDICRIKCYAVFANV